MKNTSEKERLFRKFVNNECTPEEKEWVFEYLKTNDADAALHTIIHLELVENTESEHTIDVQVSEQMYLNISKTIHKTSGPNGFNTIRYYWRLAAVFIGILIIAGIIYNTYYTNHNTTYSTGFGETLTLILPDQSRVTLNGNTTITYTTAWEEDVPREVWLKGEAFFSVRHTSNHQKFIVNTSDQLNVEVLGTEFNVFNRKATTRVVLNSGKVRLNIEDNKKDKPVTMIPGELVEFEENTESYVKKNVNAGMYSAWINKKLILENTSFREIVSLLEDTYGLSVIVPNKSLYNERFSGIVPCENAEMLLKALSLSFNLNIHKQANQVKFQPN